MISGSARNAHPAPSEPRSPAAAGVVQALLFALLLAWLVPGPVAAHNFTPVGATNGLEARIVPSLLVDRDGFLWIGSREGLFRYDGYEPMAFLPDADDPGAISDIDIRCVYQDSDGDLWAGTYSGGLNHYDTATGEFRHFRHDSTDPGSIIDDSILAIAEGPEGGLWVATRMGLSRLDHSSGRFEQFRHDPADPSSLVENHASVLHRGPSGQLWVGTIGGGVNRWNSQSRSFTRFDLAVLSGGPAELNDVFSLHEDRDGRLWAGTRVGLVRLDPTAGEAREWPLPGTREFLPAITALAADAQDRLWLGTLAHGVLIIDMRSAGPDARNADHFHPGSHLLDHPQMSLAMSRDMLFVGTWSGGVYRTTSHSTNFELLNQSNSEGLPEQNITAVLAMPEPGRPWLGTQGGGPVRVDVSTRKAETIEAFSESLNNAFVADLARGEPGQFWAGTSLGLFGFSESGVETTQLMHDPADPESIGEGNVRALLATVGSALWFGTEGSGLYHLEQAGGKLQNFRHEATQADSLSGDFITAVLTGPEGHLWIGTRSQGLNLCRIAAWSCQRFSSDQSTPGQLGHFHVTTLFRDRAGETWVGTAGGGLHRVRWDQQGRVSGFQRWTREQGLLDDGIMAIQQDRDGSLWLSTRRGLTRLQPDNNEVINYVAESGLPTTLFNSNATAADDRFIYFGSVQGLLSLPQGSSFTPRQPANVRIASIERSAPGGQNEPLHWDGGRLSVAYGTVLSIRLAALDLAETAHEYAYRLHADDLWTGMGSQRHLILHGLAPGEYAFQARGRDIFGSWGESPTLMLEIVPPFWMTNGFRALVALALLLAALAAHLVRQSALQRRAREIQRLSEKREQALEQKLGSEAELAVLTPRQKEVLQLMAEGHPTKEIAERLGVSIKTVEAHRANLMDRLDIHDVPGLVRLAVRSNLVSQYD
jgi:ligand-binding sensor domain-containing protein/DNA-binding CsgD family transcriptional regulator